MAGRQARQWHLTLNNPKDKGYDCQKLLDKLKTLKGLAYYYAAPEVGKKEETPHIHCFVCFSHGVRFTTLKRLLPEAHIEPVEGTVNDNIRYISKSQADCSNILEWGTRPRSVRKVRYGIDDIYEWIKDGKTDSEIIELYPSAIKMITDIDRARTVYLSDKYKKERRTDLLVTYIYGATGKGKTRSILDEYGDDKVNRVTDYQHPFDGYDAARNVLVFEEFRSSLPIGDMLNYLDIYPVMLPARYSNKVATYNRVYIVSNWSLEQQYSNVKSDKEQLPTYNAFLRRIHKVVVYDKNGNVTEYDGVDKYLNREEKFEDVKQDELPFE